MNTPNLHIAAQPLPGSRVLFWAVALSTLTLSAGLAQSTSVPSVHSLTPPSEEAVELSPIEVRVDRDNGYYTPDTLSGGRTNTALKDTPAALTVLNRQFLDDIAATDIYQAEIWTVNAAPTYNPGNATTGSNNRGPNFSFFSRNYFLWYTKSDTYNTERFEFARGPNGVLFGDGNIGGLASTMTKQAYLGKKSYSFSTRADSYGGYRATADLSVPLGERMALRLNLLHDRGTMWQDHSNQFRDGAHLAGTIKLFDKTNFRFEGEVGDIDRQIYITNYAENVSYWDRTTVYNGVTPLNTAAGGPGVTRVSTLSSWFVDVPGTPGVGYSNWNTFYRSTGSGVAMRDYVRTDVPVALPVLPNREFNLMPPDARYRLKYATSTFYLEHQFSNDLFAQVAFNTARTPYEPRITDSSLSQYYVDVNTVLPTGAPNPNFGKAYAETALNKTFQMNTVTEVRGLVAYRFDTKWWKGNINALGGVRFDKFDFSKKLLAQTNAGTPVTNNENEYHLRVYWDEPVDFEMPNIPGRTFDYAKYTDEQHQRKFIDYLQLATVNKFFGDRLTVFLGGRMDHVYQTQRKFIRNDLTTGLPLLGATIIPPGGKAAVSTVGAKSVIDESPISKNGGLVYYVLPWVGLYYNYSQAFGVPDAGNNLIDGGVPPVSRSDTNEFGIKLNLLKGKVYADIRYYDSQQTDALTTTGAATQINSIWTQLGRTELSNLAYRDKLSLSLKGYEFELVANPTRNLRLIANYSLPKDQRNIDALPGLRAYYAEHLAEWKAAAATNAIIQTQLASIDTLLANNTTFAVPNGLTKYRANLYGTYSFYSGKLNGFAFGGGTNVVGPAKVGSGLTAFNYLYSDPFFLLSSHVSYTTQVGKATLKLQLNVNNMLNESDPVATSFAAYRQSGVTANTPTFVPAAYRYNDPRQFILSATVTF
jgi:outer membrane receptor protein involved in Fe transport